MMWPIFSKELKRDRVIESLLAEVKHERQKTARAEQRTQTQKEYNAFYMRNVSQDKQRIELLQIEVAQLKRELSA